MVRNIKDAAVKSKGGGYDKGNIRKRLETISRKAAYLARYIYIDKLNQEYIEILSSSDNPADKFWELEKRINTDKHKTGVTCDMRRSKTIENIITLIKEGVSVTDDLLDLSDNLVSTVQLILELYQGEKSAKDNGWGEQL